MTKLCAQTGKIRYRTDLDAKIDLARIRRWSDAPKLPKREYLCPFCAQWHLTSAARK